MYLNHSKRKDLSGCAHTGCAHTNKFLLVSKADVRACICITGETTILEDISLLLHELQEQKLLGDEI